MRRGILASFTLLTALVGVAHAEPPPVGAPAAITYHDDAPVGGCTACGDWGMAQPCSASSQLTLRAEYLLWWIKDGPLSTPLVTTGTPDSEGILGNQGTAVLVGSDIEFDWFSGIRLTGDWWLD
jgi:hypothetical protein